MKHLAPDAIAPPGPLLEVRGLRKYFPVHKGLFGRKVADVKAVDGVSFDLFRQETLGLVGESGCGKTTVGRTVLRLIEPTAGSARFQGHDLFEMDEPTLRAQRKDMQIIFQDPFGSLNPRMTVGNIIGDALELHGIAHGDARFDVAREMLVRVGLQASYINRYPHEFSGGQRQRVGIARAVALRPKYVVCDESVSALDVSVQAQILNLLMDLQQEFHLSYVFIAHDLSVVRHIADRVAVMYLGRIVEVAPTADLFAHPLHPYTQALLSAIPRPDPRRRSDRVILQGDVPNPIAPPPGCHFHTRCPLVEDRCRTETPELELRRDGHEVRCHLYDGATFPAEVIPLVPRRRASPPLEEDTPPAGQELLRTSSHEAAPVAIPDVLKDRSGMRLGPFGEIVDPEDTFIATAEIPTLSALGATTRPGAAVALPDPTPPDDPDAFAVAPRGPRASRFAPRFLPAEPGSGSDPDLIATVQVSSIRRKRKPEQEQEQIAPPSPPGEPSAATLEAFEATDSEPPVQHEDD